MDIFDEKVIKPMLIGEQAEAFDSPDYIYEIKFDGIRCLAYMDNTGTDLRNKRNKKLLPHAPELSQIHKQVDAKCILDGELFVLKDGITDFYEIQRRALMTRTKDWVKCKVMASDDCVICGYTQKEKSMTSLILGQYKGDELIYRGHVTLGVTLRNLLSHEPVRIDCSPFGYVPPGNENAIWLQPELVCIVESMPTEKDSFRHPVFRGMRDDKIPIECQMWESK